MDALVGDVVLGEERHHVGVGHRHREPDVGGGVGRARASGEAVVVGSQRVAVAVAREHLDHAHEAVVEGAAALDHRRLEA